MRRHILLGVLALCVCALVGWHLFSGLADKALNKVQRQLENDQDEDRIRFVEFVEKTARSYAEDKLSLDVGVDHIRIAAREFCPEFLREFPSRESIEALLIAKASQYAR